METNKHKKLQKSRSSQACIREGYRFYMSHFRRIFRTTWPIAIIFAVITAATSAMPVIIAPDLLLPAIAIEAVAVILLLFLVGKRLRKRGVMEQTGPLKLQSWLRHLGMILIVTIVCIFVISALTLFTSLPTFIMMADYVLWLSIGVFLIAGFIQAYIWMTALGPGYLMKGSIAQQEKERKEFYKRTNDNNHHEEAAIVYRS